MWFTGKNCIIFDKEHVTVSEVDSKACCEKKCLRTTENAPSNAYRIGVPISQIYRKVKVIIKSETWPPYFASSNLYMQQDSMLSKHTAGSAKIQRKNEDKPKLNLNKGKGRSQG